MKSFYKILRTLILCLLALALAIPTFIYIGLELECVQNPARQRAEKELSSLLGVNVSIGQVSIAPFNRLTLRNILIIDSIGDSIASLRRIGAGVDLYKLIFEHRLVLGYAEIIGLDAKLYRESPEAPLNIQPIINALKPKDDSNGPKEFDISIRTVILRRSSLSYDVGKSDTVSQIPNDNKFDPHHLKINKLRADIRIPQLSPDSISISINRLAFETADGNLSLTSLSGDALIGKELLTVVAPEIEFNNSKLYFSDLQFPIKSNDPLISRLNNFPIKLSILSGSRVKTSDLSFFIPALTDIDFEIVPEIKISGTPNRIEVNSLSLNCDMASLLIRDAVIQYPLSKDSVSVNLPELHLSANGDRLASFLLSHITLLPNNANLSTIVRNSGKIESVVSGFYTPLKSHAKGYITTDCGNINLAATLTSDSKYRYLDASVKQASLNLESLLTNLISKDNEIGNISFDGVFNGVLSHQFKPKSGDVAMSVTEFAFRGMNLDKIKMQLSFDKNIIAADIVSANRYIDLNGSARLAYISGNPHTSLDVDIRKLSSRIFSTAYPKGRISGSICADISGKNFDNADGTINLYNVYCELDSAKSAQIGNISCSMNPKESPKSITLTSDILDIAVTGEYSMTKIGVEASALLKRLFPAFPGLSPQMADISGENNFEYNIVLKPTLQIEKLFKLPVTVLENVDLSGTFDSRSSFFSLDIDAPYLLQGKKIIESTLLSAKISAHDTISPSGELTFSTLFPTKKGKTNIGFNAVGLRDHIDSRITWLLPGEQANHGDVDCSVEFASQIKSGLQKLLTSIHLNRGEAVFNDTVWSIQPSDIDISGKRITVRNFRVDGFDQFLTIDGNVSESPSDSLHICLHDIDLDYIFETLAINNAMFGGKANGNFYGSALLSSSPRIFTDDLSVQGIKYNHCLMGDAKIKSGWDMDRKAVTIYADILGEHNNLSKINGFIKPLTEELDFKFQADDVPVGFLLPFMEAFTSAVDGHASGDAHLYGTFKYLDMTGDLFARDFKLKLDFTNCWYSTTDSIKLRPGRIDIPGVKIRDTYGNEATLSGLVTHSFFKEPRFRFNVTEADNLLLYDVAESPDINWYGKIFGNGGATINGEPGVIDIDVNVSTAPGSSFAFVLSDSEQAYDYNFITFRDKSGKKKDVSSALPPIVKNIKEKISNQHAAEIPTVYNMNIAVDVNDNTVVTLVMDPVGGDKIRAFGKGNLRMTYSSSDEKLGMFGSYILSEGAYNFTLQDIIIKDFTIREGSEISFKGDPYTASLNVDAVYSLNANLSDLDESFNQDKELSRTSVPIHALLKVTGNIRQPEVNFDLEFPTLTQDTYRKVRSIISTEEMMNRQIIYLLALNRFYTPDYMANATKGNELVSVASSTISSQLANILGQLSDNWSIAPNFRSDKGDFSDVEFDVALSSRLLNNRLLLNGNLGYRDKTLNNNSFIGDFDLEYLLNRSGTLRLKAYNRYNDRNFYVKSALTTQGVGIIYKRDFNDIFSFLRHRKKKNVQPANDEPSDTVAPEDIPLEFVTTDSLTMDSKDPD